ncbi:MAG TPA: hypothetical protein VIL74_12680 [Pyrinomonadaceae bacterium]|jgi:hypothetical protein
MLRHSRQPKILLKNTLNAFLLIALSGVYCLFCAPTVKAAGAGGAHCPTSEIARSEHCDFSKKRKVSETSPKATGIDSFACCGPRFNFFVAKLEKNEIPQPAPALANNFFVFPESAKASPVSNAADFSYRAPVLESRDLHVRNCVFRI